MIDKEKLIEFVETSSSELSREHIDLLCENADKFVGKFPKPYEISIDFGPIFVGIFAQMTDINSRLTLMETLVKSLAEVRQSESAQWMKSDVGHIDRGDEEL